MCSGIPVFYLKFCLGRLVQKFKHALKHL